MTKECGTGVITSVHVWITLQASVTEGVGSLTILQIDLFKEVSWERRNWDISHAVIF